MIKIKDVIFSEQFFKDWETAPENIQKRFNEDVLKIAEAKQLLPGINPHKIKNHPEGWWIGYVSVGVFAWRFLFSISSSGVLVVERLLSHNAMDALLR